MKWNGDVCGCVCVCVGVGGDCAGGYVCAHRMNNMTTHARTHAMN